jgi:hypothetical protein
MTTKTELFNPGTCNGCVGGVLWGLCGAVSVRGCDLVRVVSCVVLAVLWLCCVGCQ